MSSTFRTIFAVLLAVLSAFVLLPTAIAVGRNHKDTGAIAVWNTLGLLLLGVGWLIALVKALTGQVDEVQGDAGSAKPVFMVLGLVLLAGIVANSVGPRHYDAAPAAASAFVAPVPAKSALSASAPAAAPDSAPAQEQAPAPNSAELAKSVAKISKCVKNGRDCRFQISGIATNNPLCQFQVMPETWDAFSKVDLIAYKQVAAIYLAWVNMNPEAAAESVKEGAGIPRNAPFFQKAVQRTGWVHQCKVVLSEGRDKHGLVGWVGQTLDEPVVER